MYDSRSRAIERTDRARNVQRGARLEDEVIHEDALIGAVLGVVVDEPAELSFGVVLDPGVLPERVQQPAQADRSWDVRLLTKTGGKSGDWRMEG